MPPGVYGHCAAKKQQRINLTGMHIMHIPLICTIEYSCYIFEVLS